MTIAATRHDPHKPRICATCGADEMGCAIKAGLGGRLCCDSCSHLTVTRATSETKP